VIEAYLGAGHGKAPDVEAEAEAVIATAEAVTEAAAAPPGESILEIRDASTYYGSIGAIQGVSLEVRPGEVLAILGANGSGKTTLLRTISGVLHPRHGHVLFQGKDITHMAPPQIVELGVCQVPEGRHVFPTLSVYDNLSLGAGRLHHKGAEFQEALDSVYELFPRLHERRKQAAGSLSGGEQQMLAIGRGLMAHPRLLMLDEPSMGLAPVVNATIFESLQVLNDRGLALLMVEQNAEAALEIADRAVVLVHGRVTLGGKASDMRRDPRMRSLYLGGDTDQVPVGGGVA
jgi:branched-chain amino acid transport system ATP-binding protein